MRNGNAEIEAKSRPPVANPALVSVATDLRERAVRGVEAQEREVSRGRSAARTGQVVDYLFALVYVLLGIRVLLALIGARTEAGFVQFIDAVTNPLNAPFRGILPSPTAPGGYTLVLPVLFAILMYAVLHGIVKGLLRLIGQRRGYV